MKKSRTPNNRPVKNWRKVKKKKSKTILVVQRTGGHKIFLCSHIIRRRRDIRSTIAGQIEIHFLRMCIIRLVYKLTVMRYMVYIPIYRAEFDRWKINIIHFARKPPTPLFLPSYFRNRLLSSNIDSEETFRRSYHNILYNILLFCKPS